MSFYWVTTCVWAVAFALLQGSDAGRVVQDLETGMHRSVANASLTIKCGLYCNRQSDCTYPSCKSCPMCRSSIHRAPSACPSYCSKRDDCKMFSSVCTASRCPELCGSRSGSDGSGSGSKSSSDNCPSYCVKRDDCKMFSSVCTSTRCPELCGSRSGSDGSRSGSKSSSDQSVDELMAELDSLVGLAKVKDQMKELIAQVQFNMERKKLGLPDIGGQSLHMSFLGNPGTGKTVVARIVGQLLVTMGAIKPSGAKKNPKDVVVEVSRADLVAEYTGQTAPKVQKAVRSALGGVLFIDEAYALVQGDRDTFGNEAVDTLIKEMEDNRDKLIVILAGYQTEMASFLAANPGFKSRVAFHFSFPDYTCSELVKIGELLLKGKNVALTSDADKEGFVCSPEAGAAPKACDWLSSGVRLRTGCCHEQNCGKEENRANGNGRAVRNVLESSYRSMARRVLNTYTPALLEQWDSKYRPSVSQSKLGGKSARPNPPLDCGRDFDAVRGGGPYVALTDGGFPDVRCAFWLLEANDFQSSLESSISEQLAANCIKLKKPMTVNVTLALEAPGAAETLDWDNLHEQLFVGYLCDEPQRALERPKSFLQLKDSVTASLSSSEELTYCDRYYCKSSYDCKYSKCKTCDLCKKKTPTHGGSSLSTKCRPSMCTSRSDCRNPICTGCAICKQSNPVADAACYSSCKRSDCSFSMCLGCSFCQRGNGIQTPTTKTPTTTGVVKDIKCATCSHFKLKLAGMSRYQLEALDAGRECRSFLLGKGEYNQIDIQDCKDNLKKTIMFAKIRPGGDFYCSTAVGDRCLESSGVDTPTRPIISKPVTDSIVDLGGHNAPEPVTRPGSKVEELVKEMNSLVGLDDVKQGINALRDAVEFDMWRKKFLGEEWSLLGQSFHMRFLGNPGTGKTVVARIVGKILVELGVVKKEKSSGWNSKSSKDADDLIFKEVSRADLVAGYVGQTAPKVQAAVRSAFGGVLFIDEAYALVQGDKDSFGREAVDTLIKEIEDHRDKVIVIFAGYSTEMEDFFGANPGFQSRVPFRFEFADYSCEELGGVGDLMLKQQTIELTPSAQPWLEKVVAAKTGCCAQTDIESGTCAGATRDNGNGRSVRNILESALRAMSVRAVAAAATKRASRKLVTELEASDVAAVGGELIAEALRSTCKSSGEAVPDLETLCIGPRILALPNFGDALQSAQEHCTRTASMLEQLRPSSAVVGSAMDIPINDPKVAALFEDLDEKIGLVTVKRTMREMYTTVQFGQLRKQMSLQPLKSQSFHMRFLGNPGTGKTVVARIVGKLLLQLGAIQKPEKPPSRGAGSGSQEDSEDDEIFNEVSRSDLVAEYVGQTANKTQNWVQRSLGGVLFLDEAYALVQGERDSFGQEAVDTLIKEMEDKRKEIIVICAGYAKEMETFFDSNPGFKSRVPFTFHFEDYTCNELSQIGKLQLKKKQLEIPADLTTYDQAVRFTTGCCDRLEECEESKDKGNGRAVRNAVESGIRAMARRLADDNSTPTKAHYSRMVEEDFAAVTQQMIDARLVVPCGSNGELQKLFNAVSKASLGVLEDLPGGKRGETLARVQRLVEETKLVTSLEGLDDHSQALGQQCRQKLESLKGGLVAKLREVCGSGENSILFSIRKVLQDETDSESVQLYARMLTSAVEDQAFMRKLGGLLQGSEQDSWASLESSCDQTVHSIENVKFQVPFAYIRDS
eukprot:TRINITY_DN8302_c0_g1_i1.p1 TRINITY_DN8302_c0_g1~~TRINITY_DN8302_c0_g1_i1.p1  ORF type:complete len:1700 (-),score=330.39 TRINITY_DN8302_c0_g1_i1:56-5155(-)